MPVRRGQDPSHEYRREKQKSLKRSRLSCPATHQLWLRYGFFWGSDAYLGVVMMMTPEKVCNSAGTRTWRWNKPLIRKDK